MAKAVTLLIQGMHCNGCALGLRAALKKLPQVLSADVSFKESRAVVECDEALLNEAVLREAVRGAGFEVAEIQ